MTFLPKPTTKGTYRIKLLSRDAYMHNIYEDNPYVRVSALEASSNAQKWLIDPGANDTYKITAVDGNYGLVDSKKGYQGFGFPLAYQQTPSDTWVIKEQTSGSVKFSKITVSGRPHPLEATTDQYYPYEYVRFQRDNTSENQRWVFQNLDNSGTTPPVVNPDDKTPPIDNNKKSKNFQSRFFKLTVEEAKKSQYDIIIIGTGIGGGIIAGDLFDTNSRLGKNAKSILVIERGDLLFHSHCLNAARPSGLGEDRGQQNDTFFADFRDDYKLSQTTIAKDWKGGPVYCLGGRSAVWGLFAPRVHEDNLRDDFCESVCNDLVAKYFGQAEDLMKLSLPQTKTIHQALMERLNLRNQPEVQWQWGRIASEFRDDKNFDFAEGAYSTIDKLLEIAMSKPRNDKGVETEHINFKILLGTEVRSLQFDSSKRVTGVSVRTSDGKNDSIPIKAGGKVIVCAGSVASPAILLRSGVNLKDNGGLRLTDHDIFFKAAPFQYRNPSDRRLVESMKLQTYTKLRGGEIVLCNMSIDASSFLPRKNTTLDDFPKWIISFIRPCGLYSGNTIEMVNDEPVVTINRENKFNANDASITPLQTLTNTALAAIRDVLKVDFIPDPTDVNPPFFKPLELGGVAHELGTIPMKGSEAKSAPYCLDENLKLVGYEGVYVCDLSVFPFSPEANPTLTLAGLALRLSRDTLLPRDKLFNTGGQGFLNLDKDTVYVVNHTGKPIKVWLGNHAKVDSPGEQNDVVLKEGDHAEWKRKNGTPETVSVFRLQYKSWTDFLTQPELSFALPGQLTPIT